MTVRASPRADGPKVDGQVVAHLPIPRTIPFLIQVDDTFDDFSLADRIKAKVESGKPLDIYVSYHDVSSRRSSSPACRRPARRTR